MRERLKEMLELNKRYKKCILWGTGNTAELLQEGLKRISDELEVITCTDGNPNKWGTKWNGYDVISPNDIGEVDDTVVLISAARRGALQEIKNKCEELGISNYMSVDEYILKLHSDDVLKCYDLFDDEDSKRVYSDLIEARVKDKGRPCSNLKNGKQYFCVPEFMGSLKDGAFVDCGAFAGDTIEEFIWEMGGVPRRIIAFEPDEDNFSAMVKRIERLNEEWNIPGGMISLNKLAVSDEETVLYVDRIQNTNGIGSKVKYEKTESGVSCESIMLDNFLDEKVAFIKADVESYEYRVIKGARRLISKWYPNLAICIYHNPIDMFYLQLYIKSLVPEYRFAVRHHTYTLEDTILYAWIPQ